MSNAPINANLTAINTDRNKPVLDIKNTDIGAVMRYLATEFFKNDTLAGVTELDGVITRVIHNSASFDWSIFNIINNSTDTNKLRYKVWVHDLYFIFDNEEESKKQNQPYYIPNDNTEYGRYVISSLPDFIVTNGELSSLAVGDRVRVAFTDMKSFKGGIIKEKSNVASNGQATAGQNSNAQSAYSSSIPGPTIASQADDEEILLYRPDGKPNTKVKAKKIPSADGNKKLLPVQMAEDFKAMAEEAKRSGYNLTATSAYRGIEDQIKIFDERWTLKYSEGLPKILSKSAGGINTLNSTGKARGIAAVPGRSPHNRGVAVDISLGPSTNLLSKFKTPIYLWLKENAYKYGFFNTGKLIKSTPEAFHWQYRPADKGKREAIVLPPASWESE